MLVLDFTQINAKFLTSDNRLVTMKSLSEEAISLFSFKLPFRIEALVLNRFEKIYKVLKSTFPTNLSRLFCFYSCPGKRQLKAKQKSKMQNFSGRKLKKCKNESLKCHQSVRKKWLDVEAKRLWQTVFSWLLLFLLKRFFCKNCYFSDLDQSFS